MFDLPAQFDSVYRLFACPAGLQTLPFFCCSSQARQFYAAFVKKNADCINTKYAVEMWHRTAWNQLPHLVPQGSGHMDGAILLATRWSR